MFNHQESTKAFYCNEYSLKSGQKLIVRSPEVEDAQELIDYMKIVDNETKFLAREPDEFDLTLDQEKAFIESTLKNSTALFLVGVIENQIVGNCSVGIVMNKRRFKHRAALGISIRKDFWALGIGKRLMNECITWCKENKVEQLELDVATENERAIALYKSLGFEVHGVKKNAVKYNDGSYVDQNFMILFLNN